MRLAGVKRVANPNYLFLDLTLARSARAGSFDLVFRRGAEQLRVPYELRARRSRPAAPASAMPT